MKASSAKAILAIAAVSVSVVGCTQEASKPVAPVPATSNAAPASAPAPTGTPAAAPVAAVPATGLAPECPSLEFAAFIKAYRESPRLQDLFTADVVTYGDLDDSGDSPQPRTVSKNKKDLIAPLIDRQATIDAQGIRVKTQEAAQEATVVENKDGTGLLKEYGFVQRDGCWFLSTFNDEST